MIAREASRQEPVTVILASSVSPAPVTMMSQQQVRLVADSRLAVAVSLPDAALLRNWMLLDSVTTR